MLGVEVLLPLALPGKQSPKLVTGSEAQGAVLPAPGPAWASLLLAPTQACPLGALGSRWPYPKPRQLRGLLLSVWDPGPTLPDGAFLPRGWPLSETDCPWSPVPRRVTMAL